LSLIKNKKDGKIYTFGLNLKGVLGIGVSYGTWPQQTTPIMVNTSSLSNNVNVTKISAGDYFVIALISGRSNFC